jgi:ATP-dependent Clp protease ATP-binding subunit ClpB
MPEGAEQEPTQIPISMQLEQAFVKANAFAHETGANVVALEHVFYGLIKIHDSIQEIMNSLGVSEMMVREAVLKFREGNTSRTEDTTESESGSTRNLRKYSTCLTDMANEGKLEPVIGRDEETRRILQILSRKTKNNPILIGAPGTGKTAVVEGLAQRLVRGDVPQELKGLKIYTLDLPSMLAGASAPGEFESRLKKVIKDVKSDPNIVLFIDEIHLLIGAGRYGGAMDAANILKPELARGEIKIIGATTLDEYTKFVESDKAFERRFQKIVLDAPDEESAITIMRGIKQRFETFHRIKILDEALVSSVRLSQRYITDRQLPDKAIDLLDEAASRMRIERSSVPVELDELSRLIRSKEMERESLRQDEQVHDLRELDMEIENLREKENTLNAKWRNERALFEHVQQKRDELESLKTAYEAAESGGRYDEAVSVRDKMNALQAEIARLSESSDNSLLKNALDDEDIRQVVTAWTGIPVQKLKEDDSEKLLLLEETLQKSVIGQDEAVAAICNVIRRNKLGFGDVGRPIGSFFFMGTTGVGKTQLAKAIADYLFNSKEMMVRIDMSEYQQEFAVSRLFGAPPGYVGYDQGGQLTEAVRRKPYSVVLLDEIEKAHPKVFETLLQVLDDGRMTDGQGRTVDFKNTIIIMTSNIKIEELRSRLAPEFINRIDDIIHFNNLGMEQIREICRLQMNNQKEKLRSSGIMISFTDSAIDALCRLSYEPQYGARPVKRAVNDYIINGLTMKLLSREITKEKEILIDTNEDGFIFTNLEA